MGEDKKYSFETRGNNTIKTYSYDYSLAYHKRLNGMVERQMINAVKMTADFWYTCWVDAGQPDLDKLINFAFSEEELKKKKEELEKWKEVKYKSREHESR